MTDSDPAGHISSRDFKFVVGTIFFMLLLNIPAAVYGLGWKSAAFNTAFMCVVFAVYIWKFRDSYLLGWAVFGVAAGFTELLADYWLVTRTESLVYPQDEPMLVVSPMYMPLSLIHI